MSDEQTTFGSNYRRSKKAKRKRTKPNETAPLTPEHDNQPVSYRIGKTTQRRVSTTAKQERVKVADLVKFLINYGIDQIESGELVLPVEDPPDYKRNIKSDR